jgi:glucokinase
MNVPTIGVVCLDIGGTSVKAGVVGRDGAVAVSSSFTRPVDSGGTAESILETFAASAGTCIDFARSRGVTVAGIGVSICGPFDYQHGISHIRGLDKYEAIYGVNVKEYLRNSLELPASLPLLFDIDAWSFGRGEVWYGAGRDYDRVIVFTMGTGVGSAFAVHRRIVAEGPGVPWLGWISGQHHREGILNDYISRTFMIRRYREKTGIEIDVKQMAERAAGGDRIARDVFTEVGAELGGFLRQHHVSEFGAECLIFGGRISKSFDLFADPIRESLRAIGSVKAILPAADIEWSALRGVARYVFDFIGEPASG